MLIEGDNLISRKWQENGFTVISVSDIKKCLKIKKHLYYMATCRITLNNISV